MTKMSEEFQTFLGVAALGVGVLGLWYVMQPKAAQASTPSDPTGALYWNNSNLPSGVAGNVSAVPALTNASTGATTPSIPATPLDNITLNVPTPTIPNFSDPITLVFYNPNGSSVQIPSYVSAGGGSGGGGPSAPSPDGGITGGSCGCGCSGGTAGSNSFLGNTIDALLAQKVLSQKSASWTPIPGFAPAPWPTPPLIQQAIGPSGTNQSPAVAPGVPGYNGGQAIGASG
jgi:hypothetical protein